MRGYIYVVFEFPRELYTPSGEPSGECRAWLPWPCGYLADVLARGAHVVGITDDLGELERLLAAEGIDTQ